MNKAIDTNMTADFSKTNNKKDYILIKSNKYTTGEEIVHVISHLIGALLSIYGTVILFKASKTPVEALSTVIFGASLFLMFFSSSCYHAMTNPIVKLNCEKIDHSAIYILIAGTYTPALFLVLKFPYDVIMLVVIWFLAVLGIIFTCINLKGKVFSTVIYLLMGWLSVFFVYYVWNVSHFVVWLLLGGGVFYSIGCVFYLMKTRYMHFIWHLCVLAGAAMQYFAIIELLGSF